MPKCVIKSDDKGLYLVSDNYVIRPKEPTTFTEGQSVTVASCKGTPVYGVGKDDNCGRGEYNEPWYNSGVSSDTYQDLQNENTRLLSETVESLEDIHSAVNNDYPVEVVDGKFNFKDVRSSHEVLVNEGNTSLINALREIVNENDDDESYLPQVDGIRSFTDYDKED